MHKTPFLGELRREVCAAADAELAAAGRSTEGCPYIEKWIGHYQAKDSRYIERSLHKYAPEAAGVRAARDYIPIVSARIRRSVAVWAKTGRLTGVPDDLAGEVGAGGIAGVLGGFASGVAGAVGGLVSGIGKAFSAIGSLFFKANPGGPSSVDAAHIDSGLGAGQPLDSGVKQRMESAFGLSFPNVKVHNDANAGRLSAELNARAFTYGEHVAFGAGEYRPGSIVGDALIAHELAHVAQQSGPTGKPEAAGAGERASIENDADRSAAGAVLSLWHPGTAGSGGNAGPRERSGLALRRCHRHKPPQTPVSPQTPSQAAPPAQAPVHSGMDTSVCGVVSGGMKDEQAEPIRACLAHTTFFKFMSQSVASMKTVQTPFAPGVAQLYEAWLKQVEAAGSQDPPTPKTPKDYTVSVPLRISASTTFSGETSTLSLTQREPETGNGEYSEFGGKVELNETSGSAYTNDQPDIERTMYHEVVHYFNAIVTDKNRRAGTTAPPGAQVEPELDKQLSDPFKAKFVAAATPIFAEALNKVKSMQPPAADKLAMGQWDFKAQDELIARVEEAAYLAARAGRSFDESDIKSFPQPWLLTPQYWHSGVFFDHDEMKAFLKSKEADIDSTVLPVIREIQLAYWKARPGK